MVSQEVFILFTMDVEPTASKAGSSGPASSAAGMRAVQDYRDVLGAWNYRPTYFVHPEVACEHPELFRGLTRDGCALGLHVHTTKFAPTPQPCELGGLTADQQLEILRAAAEMFETAIGFWPTLFRPGCFSANDSTYGVLVELGFTGGGISIPGRIWPDRFCVWSGTYPYAHFAHGAFRQSEGELPFVDIPLSVDLASPLCHHPVGFYHYPDLRPGGVYTQDDEVQRDRREMLHNILRTMAADNPSIKTLVVDVHNDRDFTTDGSQAATHLRTVLEGIEPECKELGLRPVPGTYDQIVERFA